MRKIIFNKAGERFLLWEVLKFLFYTYFFNLAVGATLVGSSPFPIEYILINLFTSWVVISAFLVYYPGALVNRKRYSNFAGLFLENIEFGRFDVQSAKWLWFPVETYAVSLPLKITPIHKEELMYNAPLRELTKKKLDIIKVEANDDEFFYIVKDFFNPEELAYFLPKESPSSDQTPPS
jgi:hypothetical protein